MLKVNKSII